MKKLYKQPEMKSDNLGNPAAPLAFFSAATAASAVAGAAVGAVATKAAIRAVPDEKQNHFLIEIKD